MFRKKVLYLSVVTLLLSSTSCTTVVNKIDKDSNMIEKDFVDYVDRFDKISTKLTGWKPPLDNVIIKKQKMKPKVRIMRKNTLKHRSRVAAYCVPSKTTPIIVVNTSVWNGLSDLLREQLIFHELGHCVLNRPHCNYYDYRGTPLSLMRDHLLPAFYYYRFRDYYHNELFKQPVCR